MGAKSPLEQVSNVLMTNPLTAAFGAVGNFAGNKIRKSKEAQAQADASSQAAQQQAEAVSADQVKKREARSRAYAALFSPLPDSGSRNNFGNSGRATLLGN